MQLISLLLGSIMIVNIFLAFTVIFLERKNASSTWAWLMVLFFIPILGFLLYLILGRSLTNERIFKWDSRSRLGVEKAVAEQLEVLEADELPYKQPVLEKYKQLFYLHLKHNDAIYSNNNDVVLFTDGTEKFASLLEDMERASDHIHLLYYIIRHDQLGTKIANTLIRKAREGVEVRVLYDDMGSRLLSQRFVGRLRDAGVEVESFFPSWIPRINFKINFRNHRKLAIIDGKTGYIGGFNIGDEYLGRSEKFGYWRDTHLRITGDAVKTMQIRFFLDWNQAASRDIVYEERFFVGVGDVDPVGVAGDGNLPGKNASVNSELDGDADLSSNGIETSDSENVGERRVSSTNSENVGDVGVAGDSGNLKDVGDVSETGDSDDSQDEGDVGVQIVSSGPDQQWEQIKYGYIKMIMEAKEYVYIQTPYFIPDESLMDALRIAALSGVKIKIMIPNKPDHMFVYWATLSHIGELLNEGAEVYLYQNGFLHAKTIVVDGKISSVGTANIDVRSFRLNFEINAFLYDVGIAKELVDAFQQDVLLSTQMTKMLYEKRSLGIRFKESISRLLSPIL